MPHYLEVKTIMSQDDLSGASGIATGAVNYFEVDDATGAFVRVFAPLVNLDHYELVVRLNNEDIAFQSAYDLLQMRVGDSFLRAFVYKKPSESIGQFYLLPEHATFQPADAEVVGPAVTRDDQLNQLDSDPDIIRLKARLEQSRENTKAAFASASKMLQDQGVTLQQIKSDATPEAFLAAITGNTTPPASPPGGSTAPQASVSSLTQVRVVSQSSKGRKRIRVASKDTSGKKKGKKPKLPKNMKTGQAQNLQKLLSKD
jgi:hypothetical protein